MAGHACVSGATDEATSSCGFCQVFRAAKALLIGINNRHDVAAIDVDLQDGITF
jgi:hypothetical protein